MKEAAEYPNHLSDLGSAMNSTMELVMTPKEDVFDDTLLRLNTIPDTIRTGATEKYHGSDPDSHGKNHSSSKWPTRVAILMLCHLIFSIISWTMLLILATTCTDGTRCQPQFLVNFTDPPTDVRQALDTAREGLNMMSYLAKDLSPALNDNLSLLSQDSSTYSEVIDTLLTDNEYLFSFHGYCRHHIANGSRICSRIAGFDVALAIIKDIGDQLGHISRADDFLDMGAYFLTTYLCVLKELERIWRTSHEKTNMGRQNWRALALAHHLMLLRSYARGMRTFSDLLVILSTFSCLMSGGSWAAFHYFPAPRPCLYRLLTIPSFMVTTSIFLLSISILLSEFIFMHITSLYFKQAAVALISYGPGLHVFIFHTAMSCVSFAVGICLVCRNFEQSRTGSEILAG